MRIYLAARYSRRRECLVIADDLTELLGRVEITRRWISGSHQIDDQGLSAEANRQERVRLATEDWEDIGRAEWCISLSEAPRSTSSRGGRHVELGIALALGQRVIVVGPAENVFHCLPQVERFDTWPDCFSQLASEIHENWWEAI